MCLFACLQPLVFSTMLELTLLMLVKNIFWGVEQHYSTLINFSIWLKNLFHIFKSILIHVLSQMSSLVYHVFSNLHVGEVDLSLMQWFTFSNVLTYVFDVLIFVFPVGTCVLCYQLLWFCATCQDLHWDLFYKTHFNVFSFKRFILNFKNTNYQILL